MEIADFLLKYPYIDSISSDKDTLDTYTIPLQQAIYDKKEFYDFRLSAIESKPKNRGDLMRHQRIAQRYMSEHTLYDGVLLFHEVGTGKTCSAVAIAEGLRESKFYKRCIVLVKGEPRIFNFMKEIAFTCTDGRYIPANWEELTGREKTIRLSKAVSTYYKFGTFATFAKRLADMSDRAILADYDDSVIIIDEVHNIRAKNKAEKDTYSQIHRFLHTLKNKKVILLTGTPMKDSPKELSDIMNLILPESDQMATSDRFNEEYLEKIGTQQGVDLYDLSEEGKVRIHYHLNGRISYLKAINDPTLKQRFIGRKDIGSLKHFITYPSAMQDLQVKSYNRAISMDISETDDSRIADAGKEDITDAKKEELGVYKNSKQASMFVFPDGTWGSEGYKTYVKEEKSRIYKDAPLVYKFTEAMTSLFRDKSTEEKLDIIRGMSCKYATVIENLLNNRDKNTFVYCGLVYGSGAIVLSILLSMFGYTQCTGKEKSDGLRYALVTGSTSDAQIREILEIYNSPENVQGRKVQVIIGTPTFSEAYSLMNVQQVHILTPHWNYAETVQAIGRGVRAFSHSELKKILGDSIITVDVFQHVALTSPGIRSIDLYMYELSEAKDVSIKNVENFIKITAYDCQLTKERNMRSNPGSRECDYKASCDYFCMDIENTHPSPLDTSSYFNIYDTYKIEEVKDMIRKLYRRRSKYHIRELVQITGAEPSEVLKALVELIASREKLRNMNNFSLYLKEHRNVYYLADISDGDSIPLDSDYFDDVYVREDESLPQLMTRYTSSTMDTTIDKLQRSVSNLEEFKAVIKTLPLDIQSMFVEYAFIARRKGIDYNKRMVDAILEVYKEYLKVVNNKDILTLDEKNLKCLKGDEWVQCPESLVEAYRLSLQSNVKKLESSPIGYYGIYVMDKDQFQIRDVTDKSLIDNPDARRKTTGRTCKTIKKKNLLPIIVAAKLAYEPSGKTKNELLDIVDEDMIETKNISKMSMEDLDRIYFWNSKKIPDICSALQKWFNENELMQIV